MKPKELTTADIIEKLKNISVKTIKHYYTDFTEYDIPRILRIATEHKKVQFLWTVRDCGTYVISLDKYGRETDPGFLQAVRDNFSGQKGYKEFLIQYNGGGKWCCRRVKNFIPAKDF